jgi:hypothetical protein
MLSGAFDLSGSAELIEQFEPLVATYPQLQNAAGRIRQYHRLAEECKDDLTLLQNVGILVTLADPIYYSTERLGQLAKALSGRFSDDIEKQQVVINLSTKFPLCAVDLLPLILTLPGAPAKFIVNLVLTRDDISIRTICIIFYLLLVVLLSETTGSGTLTWDSDVQHLLAFVRAEQSLPPEQRRSMPIRRQAVAQLGNVVLENEIPMLDDLPLDEILAIREKYQPEVIAFQYGLRELAAQIDVTKTPLDMELQASDLAAARVVPAIRDLQNSMRGARLEALKKIGLSWESLAGATVPIVMSYAAGAPTDIKGAVSVLGGIFGPLIAGEIERKRLLHASQWSVLLRLKRLKPRRS